MESAIGILLKVISIVMLLLFVASVALLILTVRKPRKVSILSLLITIAISMITLVIFSSLIKYEPPPWLWLLMCFIGLCVGWFWARATKVFIKDSQIMSINSIWYLVAWGGIFALNQLIIIVTNRPPDVAMSMLIISTATVWGINGNVMRRYFKMKLGLQPAMVIDGQATTMTLPTSRSTSASPEAKYTPQKQTQVAEPHPAGYCTQCGAAFKKDAAFCIRCGGKL